MRQHPTPGLTFWSKSRVAVAILAVLLSVGTAAAQEKKTQTSQDYNDLKGKRVVVTKWGAKFRLPEGTVGTSELGNVYTVDVVNGDWLWVMDAGGWLTASDIVPFEEAEEYFTARVKKDPTPDAYFERGMARLRMGELEKAMVDLDEAVLKGKGEKAEFLNGRGIAHLQQGDLQKSIADHTAAIRLNPKMSAAYYNRGNARRLMGKYDKAISDYNLAIHLNPMNGRAYINRGLCWNRKHDYERARADFNKACQMNPKWPLAYNNRADATNRLGKYQRALADCDLALKLNPTMTWAMVNRGNALNGLGKPAEAMQEYDRAIEIDSEFAPAYNYRGYTHATQGEYLKAIDDYKKAIDLDPDFAYPHNGWAWLLATCPNEPLRDGKQAVALAEAACRLDATDWRHFGTLAAAYAEADDFERAIKAQQRAIEMLPSTVSKADKAGSQERLELYESKTAYHES